MDAGEWTGNALVDAGEWTANALIDAGEWTGNAILDAGEWAGNAFEDIGEWTANAVMDIGEWTANAAVDVWDWVKEGDNWLAFGQTLMESFVSARSFKFDQAFKIFTDERRWSGDGRDEIAEEKERNDKIKQAIKEFPGKCIDYMAKIEVNELEKSNNFTASIDNILEKNYDKLVKTHNEQVAKINKSETEKYEERKAARDASRESYLK